MDSGTTPLLATTRPGDDASCDQAQPAPSPQQLVGDVMLRRPKTLPADATLDEARALFANPKVIAAVLVDGRRFVGMLYRTDLPNLVPGQLPVRTFAKRTAPTITADRPVAEAMNTLGAEGLARMVVLAEDGESLDGLLCLDRARVGFCSD